MTKLFEERDFLVRENVVLNYIVALILLAVFGISMWVSGFDADQLLLGALFFGLPVLIYIFKARRNRTYMKINRLGFFHGQSLVTDWNRFIDAEVVEQPRTGDAADYFYLIIQYYSIDRA